MKKTIPIIILILILTISIASAVGTAPTFTTSYWEMEDTTDSTGNYTLTPNNLVSGSTGIINNAYGWVDNTGSMETGINVTSTDDWSINFWVYHTSLVANTILASQWNGTNNRWMIYEGAGTNEFSFAVGTGSATNYYAGNYAPSINEWYMITLTFEDTTKTWKLYVNGSLDLTQATTPAPYFIDPLELGAYSNGAPHDFRGQIDEGYFAQGHTLTQDEIDYFFQNGAPGSDQQFPYSSVANESVNDSTESTSLIRQVGSTSFVGTTTILSGDFNVTTDNTPLYGGYTFEVSSNNNNDMFCELSINGTVKANITRTQTPGEIGNAYIMFPVETVINNGTYNQDLTCERSSGVGIITISEAVGIGHFLINQDGEFLNYNSSAVSQTVTSGSSYTLIDSLDITISNKTNSSSINPRKNHIVIESAFTYTNNDASEELINMYANVNGTNCTQLPRSVSSGSTGSVSYDCIVKNVTENSSYTVNFYGNGTNATYEGDTAIKNFFLSGNEIIGGDGAFTGLTFSNNVFTTLASGIPGGNNNHDVANVFNKLGYSITTDGDTTVSIYINVSNGAEYLTTIWQRDYVSGETGVIIGHDIFENVPKDDYNISLHANCGTNGVTCTISGGATLGYLTDVITTITHSFDITTYNNWTNTSIINFNVTDGSTVTSENGTATYFSTNDFENLTISSIGYLDTIVLNHNTSEDLNISLRQSDIKFQAFEIITGNEVAPSNFTIEGITKGTNESFYLATGSYNVTFSKEGWFDKTTEINITALDNETIAINGVSSSVLNLTVQNIINGSYIQNFSGTITSTAIGYSDTFSTTNGEILIPVINTQNFTIQLNTIQGYSDFNNSINITGPEIIPPQINRTISLYTNNSISFTIRDFDTGTLLLQLVNITMLGSTVTYDLSTSNGTLYIDQRNDDTYLTTFTTAGYSQSELFLTLENNAHLNVEVFMQTGLASKSFIVKNNNLVPIDGAILTFSTIVNGTSVVITQAETDFSGRATVQLDGSISYQFTTISDGFDVFAGSVTPTESEYGITMIQSSNSLFTTQFDDVSYAATFSYNAGANNATSGLFINSILGSLEYFGLTSTYNGITVTQNQTGSPGGGFPNITITGIDPTINNTLQVTYFFKSTGNPEFSFTENYFLSNVNGSNISIGGGLFNDIQALDDTNPMKGIIGMIIVMIGVMIFLGATRNMTVGVIGGLVGTGLNWHLELWPPNIAIITIIVGIILMIADNVR